ncbi:putative OPI10 family protein [Helianthus anomalus]
MFGVVFPNQSFPIDISTFTQINTFHWLLEMNTFPGGDGANNPTAPDAAPLSTKIGVSVDDLASLSSLDVAAEKKIERLAMKVGDNLFNFMQSFCGVDGTKLVAPMDILNRWFKKFQERAKRNPKYLKGFAL